MVIPSNTTAFSSNECRNGPFCQWEADTINVLIIIPLANPASHASSLIICFIFAVTCCCNNTSTSMSDSESASPLARDPNTISFVPENSSHTSLLNLYNTSCSLLLSRLSVRMILSPCQCFTGICPCVWQSPPCPRRATGLPGSPRGACAPVGPDSR